MARRLQPRSRSNGWACGGGYAPRTVAVRNLERSGRPAARLAAMTVTAVPDRDTLVELADGRRIALAEWGDPAGRPVFLFQGTPGSRLYNPDVETGNAAGVRLLCPDRPGYGGCHREGGRSVLDWAFDVGEVADALGIDRFPVVGWSSGGQFALACAVA